VPARYVGLASLVAVALVAVGAGRVGSQDSACTPRASPAYTARVETALRSGRDLWGTKLVASRGGPTYAAAAGRLAPLLHARTAKGESLTRSGAYYLPFSVPRGVGGATDAMLHVADGSEILARRVTGRSIEILVGADGDEPYGSCLARLTPARLAGGWLPILGTAYRDAEGGRYTQESFSARTGGELASFVRLTASADRPARLRLGALSMAVRDGEAVTLYARWRPPARPVVIDAAAYAAARASVVAYWRTRLAEGARIDVPERHVQDALRALLVQGLVLTWRYSLGNPYEQFSFPETVDVARVLGEYGFGGVERAILRAALPARPTPYPNWKMGEKLLGFGSYHGLYRDRATLADVTPTLRRFLGELERQIEPGGLLPRERYSSDIPDQVYGLHAQATIWQGLREIAGAWADTAKPALATRARTLAARLEKGIRDAVRRSQRRLADGSLFLPVRLLDGQAPYGMVTASRAGSYWNLVAPYALASGIFPPSSPEARGALRYLLLHGSRLLGLVRSGTFVLYAAEPGGAESGTNQVYGNGVSRFLADLDRPDLLTLSLYGHLAAGMTPATFVAGEGATVSPLAGAWYRAMYRPPNSAANATFLETLRLLLVHETPDGLELAFATPRAWLAPGKRIAASRVPTRFGPVSYSIEAGARSLRVLVDIPARVRPKSVRLRLRLPAGERIAAVVPKRPVDTRTQTIDLSGLRGTVELEVRRGR
jgi:hypothetical protein